jgi:hypothetical protein
MQPSCILADVAAEPEMVKLGRGSFQAPANAYQKQSWRCGKIVNAPETLHTAPAT